MPIHPTDSVTPSEPGGALRLDAKATGPAVFAGPDGMRSIGQYGAEARMTALNQGGTASVIGFGGGGGSVTPAVIPFTSVDVDYSEFGGLQQAEAQSGTFTAQVEGLYEIGVQAAFTLITASTHCCLAIWTDAGASNLPAGPLANLREAQPYGLGWQRISQRLIGYRNTYFNINPTNPDLPFHVNVCSTVVCIRQPGAGFLSALPAPSRFCFGVQTDGAGRGAVKGNVAGQTYAWMRWLGDPG